MTAAELGILVDRTIEAATHLSLYELNKNYEGAKTFLHRENLPSFKTDDIDNSATELMLRTIKNMIVLFKPEKLERYYKVLKSKAAREKYFKEENK